jgi:hypothetical protein
MIERFTLVVRLCTLTSGRPELFFSMDIVAPWTGPQSGGAHLTPWNRSHGKLRYRPQLPAIDFDRKRSGSPSDVKPLAIFKPFRRASGSQISNGGASNQSCASQHNQYDYCEGSHVSTQDRHCCFRVSVDRGRGIEARSPRGRGDVMGEQTNQAKTEFIGVGPWAGRACQRGVQSPVQKLSLRQRLLRHIKRNGDFLDFLPQRMTCRLVAPISPLPTVRIRRKRRCILEKRIVSGLKD